MEHKDFLPLNPSFKTLMFVHRSLFLLVLLIVWIAISLFAKPSWSYISVFFIGFAGWVGLAILFFVFVPIFFKRKKYRLCDKNFAYQEGVLVHKETVVPFSRIQHVEIDEGPLERLFKLASISIYTAGDSGKDLKVSGLKLTEAREIKDFITNYIKDE